MKPPRTVAALNGFGHIRLSQHFYMRGILFSDVAAVHGLLNGPDDRDLAVAARTQLIRPGTPNHEGDHRSEWELPAASFDLGRL